MEPTFIWKVIMGSISAIGFLSFFRLGLFYE
jgi:hypothetical protein